MVVVINSQKSSGRGGVMAICPYLPFLLEILKNLW
jgi:hypothetical protein